MVLATMNVSVRFMHMVSHASFESRKMQATKFPGESHRDKTNRDSPLARV